MRITLSLIMLLMSYCSYSEDLFDFIPTSSSSTTCVTKDGKQRCDVYLLSQIQAPSDYQDLAKTLSKLTTNDTVYLHLAGPGGQGDGLVFLVNAITSTKAHIISQIDGSVASADAVLDVIINGDAYIWFHNISLSNMVNETCESEQGRDRGVAQYTKCMEDMPKLVSFYNSVINRYVYPLLTKEERVLYDQGHDIIIDGKELRKRLDNRKS